MPFGPQMTELVGDSYTGVIARDLTYAHHNKETLIVDPVGAH